MKKDSNKRKKTAGKKKRAPKRIAYQRKPEDMDLIAWQIRLRQDYGQSQEFMIENVGNHPVYSEFKVFNPNFKTAYKVAIRGREPGFNFCSCPDFRTNALGTCKHVEAVLYKLYHTRGLRKYFKTAYSASYSSVFLHYGEERQIRMRIGDDHSEAYQSLAADFFDEALVLLPDVVDQFEHFLAKARQISPDFRCYEDALTYILQLRADRSRKARIDGIKGKKRYLDSLLKTKLFTYQQEGVLFAARAGRCLIADEMGLGKTIQAIATAELWKKEFQIGKVLIICPTSLKYQWKSEIEKFTDSSVHVIEGYRNKRMKQYEEDDSFYQIVTYNIATNDQDLIQATSPDVIILDEAQRIKNWNTKVSRAIKQYESPYAIVLTGTPLENKLEELYSIVQFVDIYKLGPLHQFLFKHQIKDEFGKVVGYRDLNEIKEILKGVMLRRTKKQVLKQLPERMDKNLFVPMTLEQQDQHQEFSDAVARLVAKWRRFKFLNEKDRQMLMINLNRMRMVCDSTFILDQTTRYDTKVEELMYILEEALAEPDTKAVVFSQWERMTRLIANELEKAGIGFANLHGGVPGYQRGDLLDSFNQDPNCRIFLSTDAGGLGLNLQQASLVVNMDIPWNPAVLEQRIARAYRLGQKKQVSIINLIATGTIEHRMLDTLAFKSSMAEGVLDNGEDCIFLGGERFKKFMESVEGVTGGTTTVTEEIGELVEAQSDEENYEVGAAASSEASPSPPELDWREEETEKTKEQTAPPKPAPATASGGNGSGEDLIRMGANFLGALTKTLSDPKATQNLVDSLMEKDEKSGKSYLKIPVEDADTVKTTLNLISGLVRQFMQ